MGNLGKKHTEAEAENEVIEGLEGSDITFRRTSTGVPWDVERNRYPDRDESGDKWMFILATRPDHGRWLVTMSLEDFAWLLRHLKDDAFYSVNPKIGVKRYARFSLHRIWEAMIAKIYKQLGRQSTGALYRQCIL
jgi:hypothetical protein